MFTGKVPFTGESAIAIGFQQMHDDPKKPSEMNPKISSRLEKVILRALQKNPGDRYSSMSEMRDDLQNALGQPAPESLAIQSNKTADLERLKKPTIE